MQIEQVALYDSIDFDQPLDFVDPSSGLEDNLEAARTPLRAVFCPSDSHDGTMSNQYVGSGGLGDPWAVTNYKSVAGSNWGSLGGTDPDHKHKQADPGYGYGGQRVRHVVAAYQGDIERGPVAALSVDGQALRTSIAGLDLAADLHGPGGKLLRSVRGSWSFKAHPS